MGRVFIAGGKVGINTPSPYNPVFANNTWSDIIEACQKNNIPSNWTVGDSKVMTINNRDYQIDIIGKNHDTYSTGGTAPLTFQLHECYALAYKMNSTRTNVGGWTECQMRTNHLPTILALMPTEVQSGIKEVNKFTSAGNQISTINTTADKLFLLSEIEVFGTNNASFAGEGVQYDYYASGNSRIKPMMANEGAQVIWWLRSPRSNSASFFKSVSSTGETASSYTDNSECVSFAFCF